MKAIRYLIYALTAVIVICLIILIVQPEKSLVLRPEDTVDNTAPERQPLVDAVEEDVIPEEPAIDITIPELTPEEFAAMPAFIQSLPAKANEIDSNGNRIRDDIEIYIGRNFPFEPHIRAVFIQAYEITDKLAKERGKGRLSQQFALWQREVDATQCWLKYGFSEEELEAFKGMILNNSYRREGYDATIELRQSLDQDIIDSIKIKEFPCDQMMVENQQTLQNWTPE